MAKIRIELYGGNVRVQIMINVEKEWRIFALNCIFYWPELNRMQVVVGFQPALITPRNEQAWVRRCNLHHHYYHHNHHYKTRKWDVVSNHYVGVLSIALVISKLPDFVVVLTIKTYQMLSMIKLWFYYMQKHTKSKFLPGSRLTMYKTNAINFITIFVMIMVIM